MIKAVEKNTLYCSFCGKSQNKVMKLIAGPDVFICNECVLLCMEIIVDTEFPDKLFREEPLLVRETRVEACITLVRDALESEKSRLSWVRRLETHLSKLEAPTEIETTIISFPEKTS